jgi:hypothetical protein
MCVDDASQASGTSCIIVDVTAPRTNPAARAKLRPATPEDVRAAATFEGPGDGRLTRALLAWKDGDPEADAQLLAVLREVCPEGVTPEGFLAKLRGRKQA